jgi:hypothetical protein
VQQGSVGLSVFFLLSFLLGAASSLCCPFFLVFCCFPFPAVLQDQGLCFFSVSPGISLLEMAVLA